MTAAVETLCLPKHFSNKSACFILRHDVYRDYLFLKNSSTLKSEGNICVTLICKRKLVILFEFLGFL